jgi:hypothetical protein
MIMWVENYCPVCRGKLEEAILYYELGVSKILTRCPKINRPIKGINIRYHFESFKIDNNAPYFETFVLHPYIIESYINTSNIAKYDEQYLLHHLIETPYLNLPWYDPEKVLNKIKTIILFN